jgi:hypothetical protein
MSECPLPLAVKVKVSPEVKITVNHCFTLRNHGCVRQQTYGDSFHLAKCCLGNDRHFCGNTLLFNRPFALHLARLP